MTQDEFEVVVSSLMAQYADVCTDEIAALKAEAKAEQQASGLKTRLLSDAYAIGSINGKNAEQRALQCDEYLLDATAYQADRLIADAAQITRKAASMRRIGVENEIKLWRAWLAGQGGNNGDC